MMKSSTRDEEINKAILEWLISKNYSSTSDSFLQETGMKKEDASKGNSLEKKWGTILSLQKKISDLEAQVKQLKEDLERGGGVMLSQGGKSDSDGMGLPKIPAKSTMKGHRQAVTCMAFHPFYKRLATGSEDASIIIWECDEFTPDKSIRAHSNTVNCIAFDPQGRYLASCSADLTVKIWNFETLTCMKSLNGHEHTVSSIEFMPDGNFLFSASRDKSIKFWEINTGNCKKNFLGHSEWVRSISVNRSGTLLASASDDESIIVWNVENGTQLYQLTGHENKIECVIFVKSEKAISTIYNSDYLELFNQSITVSSATDQAASTTIADEPSTSTSSMDSLAELNKKLIDKAKILQQKDVKFNKEYLLSASRDKTIKLWDIFGSVCIFTFSGHDNWVRAIAEHPSGKYFISASDDKAIRVWDFKSGLSTKNISEAHDRFVLCVAVSPKCKMIASGSNDLTIKVWDCN